MLTYSAGNSQPIPDAMSTNNRPIINETLGINGNSSNTRPISNSGNIRRTAQYICTAEEER
ncbi:hypothetical protein D3C76_1437660 [compost metagenome]